MNEIQILILSYFSTGPGASPVLYCIGIGHLFTGISTKLNTRLYLLLLLLLVLLTAIELSLGGSRPNAEVMSEWRHIHVPL